MDIILKYFTDLNDIQREQYSRLMDLYKFWNEKINVISRKDIENLYLHHVLHSLALTRVLSLKAGAEVLDVGTGGGFPGIPLAIYFPDVHFHLVDSVGKKIKVVEAVTGELGLKNVSFEQIRAEQLTSKYDFIISRAVTTLPEFVKWIGSKISKKQKHKINNGIFYLKGGDLTEELAPYKKIATVFDIYDFFKEEFFETKKIIYLPLG